MLKIWLYFYWQHWQFLPKSYLSIWTGRHPPPLRHKDFGKSLQRSRKTNKSLLRKCSTFLKRFLSVFALLWNKSCYYFCLSWRLARGMRPESVKLVGTLPPLRGPPSLSGRARVREFTSCLPWKGARCAGVQWTPRMCPEGAEGFEFHGFRLILLYHKIGSIYLYGHNYIIYDLKNL